jgi:hypothetical protein
MKETEEMIAHVNVEKQILVEQKEFIVQQLVKGMNILLVKVEQMLNFSVTFIMCFIGY